MIARVDDADYRQQVAIGVSMLWPQLLALLELRVGSMALAILCFRKSLD